MLEPTPDGLASVRDGDMLKGTSAPSKADRNNTHWGGRDMWFRVDSSNPLNFAHRYLMWERAHPCPPVERQRWPAFSLGGGRTPLRPRTWCDDGTRRPPRTC